MLIRVLVYAKQLVEMAANDSDVLNAAAAAAY
jgi:hypothetical protein